MQYFLTTGRLGFRCWDAGDLRLAMELWGDPEVTAMIGGPFTEEMVRARLEREIAQMRERGVQYWPIFLREGGEHVGCAGLRPYRDEARVYELGFHLRRAFWGQGFASEAGRAAIEYGFGTLGAEALFAGHHPKNEASRAVLLKLGFVREGEELYPPTGEMHPAYWLRRENVRFEI
ncbi:MAG TPA: GNAT family N-acetyltransferase [Candidatus Limnocylindrales bacterium]|nr:GNAT family N-acetyltransferase [Candidatus Limnocylindrales bacterium]